MDIENIITQEEEPRWIDGAKDLDVCHHSRLPQFHALSDKVFNDIKSIVAINNEKRSKYSLKTFLLNLWSSYLSDRPIMYSRNASNYNHSKRYGKLHFKYKRVKKIADTLYELGYMEQKMGYYNREDGTKRRTRIYPLQPLCDLFNHYLDVGYEVIYKEPPRETIQLRDENKKEIDYKETLQTTKQRIRLYNYNRLISNQDILVDVPCDMPIKADFIKDLNFYLTTGVIRIKRACGIINALLEYANKSSIVNSNISVEYNNNSIVNYKVSNNNSISYAIANYITDNYNNTYSYISTITNVFLVKKYSYTDEADNKEKIVLRDLGISKLVLRIDYSSLHRVYNNGSFDLGGRFYGAFHLRMPKELRPFITLNDNRVIELDYKAHHPRMLYHMEGIDYREDPYEAVCDSPEDRKLFKFVQLVAVNAENDEKAVQAMRQVIRHNGLPYSIKDKDLYPLIEKFKKAHKPIEKYLTSGIGRTLQNIDSKITEYILMTLKAKSIPALPVHDSYIVDERFEGVLAEIMNEGYEKYMGYQPVIDK